MVYLELNDCRNWAGQKTSVNAEENRYKDKKDDCDLQEEAARYHEGVEKRDHFHDQDPPKIHSLASASPSYNKK